MKLSVLMPVYNEVKTLSAVIEQVMGVDIDKEIIIVDDGSTDGSRELLESDYRDRPGIKIIFHKTNMGKGAAVKEALESATGDYAIIQDGDLEYDPQDYRLLLEKAKEGFDVVYGSRFAKTWRVTPLYHFLVNKFLTVITNILFGSKLTDMETCYKMIRTDIFKNLDIRSRHFEIEPEITAKLLKEGYQITEVPVSYKGRSYNEGKKITWKDGIETLWTLLKYRLSK